MRSASTCSSVVAAAVPLNCSVFSILFFVSSRLSINEQYVIVRIQTNPEKNIYRMFEDYLLNWI